MTLKHPYGVANDMHIKVGDNLFLFDFIVLYMDAQHMLLISRRPFLATKRALMVFNKVH